ncbi:hypothetical protein CC86DRAFT_373549 [Ophiobolus disseminans]|uniref:Transcription factor TFIIIC triple barrel domain-containing protein n=1 Tax=Ophiobolus disseminans TaxID=1469910 RepID=A0A6A6ZKY1_9PLEO|nr:hypothetical protein CC86DRAFT_373549 [Ophiobolus disseminans]
MDEDDEWEYEYDETETEDFYIPIDLSNVPSAQVPMNLERKLGHPTMLKSRLRALNATRGQLPEIPTTTPDDNDAQETPPTMGEVQISGLHTSNPLIMSNGRLLSCQWTSTIGTDMIFTKPDTGSDNLQQPLRSLPSVDLLALGTAKLVARVGRLRPLDDVINGEGDVQPDVGAGVVDVQMIETAPVALANSPPTSTIPQAGPTSFLARLNEAKARRGESSRLVVNQASSGRLVSEYVELPPRTENEEQVQANGDVSMGGT